MNKHNGRKNGATKAAGAPGRLAAMLAAIVAVNLFAMGVARADSYSFTAAAGSAIAVEPLDGTGTNAHFLNPTSVAVDTAGNIYVADGGDHTVRKVTAVGVVTTLAGGSGQAGSSDGVGANARFLYPFALAVDAAGSVYVTDTGNHNVRKITAGGVVTTLAGNAGVAGSVDATGTAALFNSPQGIAVDATGNVYVSDTNNSTIRKISADGTVTTMAGVAGQTGGTDGAGVAARFNFPRGLAVDVSANIYVADNGNSTIRRITAVGIVSTLAGSATLTGSVDAQGSAARFDHPSAVAVDAAGNVYVSDTSNHTVRKISVSGEVSTLAGTPGSSGRSDGAGAAARFFYPAGMAVTASGTVHVADTGNHTLRVVTSVGVVATLAGAAGLSGSADGVGSAALFAYPQGIAFDVSGNLYIADRNNHTIRRMTSAGVVTTFAGSAGNPGSADGVGATARFNGPAGVAVDASGNVYVADAGNSTIRKITASGTVTTFAGLAGASGSADGAGASARFNAAQGIAVDVAGNLYVADTNNSTIRKITSAGVVTTFAGSASVAGSTDSPGRFNRPHAVAVDASGTVYVADTFNATIRKISATATVTTFAGLALQAGLTDGAGAAARFNLTYALAVDGSGNVFVADAYNRVVRKITAAGVVTTVDGPNSRFYFPQGIAVDISGGLYVADGDNQAIVKGAITLPPQGGGEVKSQTVAVGANASFTVGAAASQTNYQWQVSVDGGATWTFVANDATYGGATTVTLTITDAKIGMNGNVYRAQLTNSAGTAVSGSGTLTVYVPAAATLTAQPMSQTVAAGANVTLSVSATAASGNPAPTYQWQFNGANIPGAVSATLALNNLQPAGVGLYTVVVASGMTTTSDAAIVGIATSSKVIGAGTEVASNIYLSSNGNTYDQVLLQGSAATITADSGQITRMSYIDLNDDIVQVEFSGAGALSLVLDAPTGPATAQKYNQPSVNYMKGHAGIVVAGANETTHVAVYSVGRITAVDQSLFRSDVTYDGVADIAFIAIFTTNGKFGGVRTGDTGYFATKGMTGVYAPGVQFSGPVFVSDISASAAATAAIVLGSASDTRITGGDMLQANGQPVNVSGIAQLRFVDGTNSHGMRLPAQFNRAVYLQNGTDVTSQIVVNPTP